MSPAAIALIIQGIEALLQEAPQIEAVAVEAKNFISGLFKAGVITIEQQNAIHAHVDAICAAALSGQEPPEFTIEPDPS